MVGTRSKKSASETETSQERTTDESGTATSGTATTTEGTTTTTSDPISSESRQQTNEDDTNATLTPCAPPKSTTSRASARKKALLEARAILKQKEVELAAARVALLEADASDEEPEELDNQTITEPQAVERTETWVHTLAISMEPRSTANPGETEVIGTTAAPKRIQSKTSQPQPCPDTLRQDAARRVVPTEQPNLRTSEIEHRACGNENDAYETTQRARETDYLTDAAFDDALSLSTTRRDAHTNNDSFSYKKLADAIALAARAVQPAIAPPPLPKHFIELPPFTGASSDWLPFKRAYDETARHLTEEENLSRLRRCLKGTAKEAVHCLFVGKTTTTEVMKMLENNFGRPDTIAMAEIAKMRSLPRITEAAKDVCDFASKIINCTSTIKALEKYHYLYNPEVVRQVLEKMPLALQYRYYDYEAWQPEHTPDLVKLSDFLGRCADRCGRYAPEETTTAVDRREQNTRAHMKKTARVHHTSEQKPWSSPQCPVCKKGSHRIQDCTSVKDATVSARWDIAKSHRLCFRCLNVRKFRHSCKTRTCGVDGCKCTHHPLLHDPTFEPRSYESTAHNNDEAINDVVTSTHEKRNTTALLKILPVRVAGPKGAYDTYALLDDGSTCTLIEASVAAKIGATGPAAPFCIEGVAGARIAAYESQRVHFDIGGRNSKVFNISARTMKNLRLTPQSVPASAINNCGHLEEIRDELIFEKGTPTVLLGQDNWQLLITHCVRQGEKTQPVASLTDLGWVLHGVRMRAEKQQHRVHHITTPDDENIEEMMKQHFALDALGVQPKLAYTEDERRALQLLEENTRRLPTDGFETCLLWKKENPSPPNNYNSAMKRLELVEKKLDRDETLKKRYKSQMQALLENDYAEIAPTSRPEKAWYLPHFAVVNPQKPEKLRIVHDAAAKTRGVCLNDMLLSGPDLLQSLPGVLMRFRQHPVAVAADIKDMFMRVTIREQDRDMQRFLWRDDRRDGPPTEYRMKSVIFGATSSPSTAIYVKNKNAEDFKEKYPAAAAAVVRNHYVDDYLASYATEEEAIETSFEVSYIHSRANFFLQKWTSNSRRAVAELAPGTKGDILHLDPGKILGMVWNPEHDTLSFNVNKHKIPEDILSGQRIPTKREALRTVMSLYDPLGIATPVTIQAKRILQETWRSSIDWDGALQEKEADAWKKWIAHAQQLTALAVPRCYTNFTGAHTRELHVFVDASTSAYAAAVYWRVVDQHGAVHVSLVVGKARVAPLNKVVSIPRMELQAAVLGCRLAITAAEEHDLKPTRRVYWSDSRTVLCWLRTGPRAYKPFVAHRVAEVTSETKTSEWRWVSTKENVADDATRDVPVDFDTRHRWFRGPDFLYSPEESWPRIDDVTPPTDTGEERINVAATAERLSEALPDVTRFSNCMRVIRVTARVLQVIDRLRPKETCAASYKRTKKTRDDDPTWKKINKKKTKATSPATSDGRASIKLVPLEARYLHRARQLWIRSQQQEAFTEELAALQHNKPLPSTSRLIKLSVLLDDEGIIRLRSRISAAADLTAAQSEPAVIDGHHPWTRLYVAWVHKQLHHGGFETTTNEVRQHYWVLRLRHTVRSEVKKCQVCRIRRATPAQPSTGNHPRSRLAHHQRPFTYTGLDYFGPLTVTVGRTHQKRYGVLFTCLTTRAVHLEIAGSLSTDSAIMALRRFIGRRGCPTELWSDQGTNLRGADVELRRAAREAKEEEATVHFIHWRYIPPSAPFMGGAWERLVRSVKTALHVTLNERAPKEEVLATLLVEAEHTINSRPLTHVSTSPDDEEAITPNHFLLGGPSRVPMPGAFTEGDVAGRADWRKSQRLADLFWARWVREYLPELQHRREPRATKGAIRLQDLVLIADGTLPRNSWPRGIVVATYPGPDGEIRAVDVRTNKGVLRRPTKKLVILPSSPTPSTSSHEPGQREHEESSATRAAAGEYVRDI